MPKFFFDESCIDGDCINIQGETAHHIVNVLRYRVGDKVIFCNGNNIDYHTKLISFEKKKVVARLEVLKIKKTQTESPIFVCLFQSVIKWENFDFAIQKSVEVGVGEIVPIVTERSIYKISEVEKKTERFNRIAKSAAEQSMRGVIPKIKLPISFNEALVGKESTACFACCDEKKSLASFIEASSSNRIDIWIGPEGGFTDNEKKFLIENNIIPFTLGERVLRSETASIVSIAYTHLLFNCLPRSS